MRRLSPLAASCSLVAIVLALTSPPEAAAARFRFGTPPAPRQHPATAAARPDGGNAVSAWTGCGITLTPATTTFTFVQTVVPEGGGAIVTWSDARNSPVAGNLDAFATKLNSSGDLVAGWALTGNTVSLQTPTDSSQVVTSGGTDGAGGLFVTYTNVDPQFQNSHDGYLQHLTTAGAVAGGYPASGKKIVSGSVGTLGMIADGAGGVYFGWSSPSGSTIRIKRLDANGTETGGWPAAGLDTGVPDDASGEPVPDGTGGVYGVWATGNQILVQRVNASGVVAGWPAGGLVVFTAAQPFSDAVNPRIVRLSSGDALVAWDDPDLGKVVVQRVTSAGAVHASWPAAGLQVSTGTDLQALPDVIADGAGGALVAWQENSFFPLPSFKIFVQRVTALGAISSGWPAGGVPVSTGATAFIPSNIISDGGNGALIAWTDVGSGFGDILAQHIMSTGVTDPGWAADGVPVCNGAGDQSLAVIASDGAGGAVVTWQDFTDTSNPQLLIGRILSDGTVSALASLVDATAEPGLVRLHWYTPDGSVMRATVERAEMGGEFATIGEVMADGSGNLRFEDRAVAAGATYQYRLAVPDGGTTAYLGQVTIRVPASLAFGIEGIRPNPAGGELSVAFALEGGGSARIELLDVAGRRVLAREVGSMGPGQHVLRLEEAKRLPAGIYTVRLIQGARAVAARAAIVR
ncbi:MAG TPA: hypothetical protein VJY35_15705 [Candidatus Eisenbacteria bacterium]|nr:hypothetical protein [Candidatus Eisenbacteria bacterium]